MDRPLPPYPTSGGSYVLDEASWAWVRAKTVKSAKAKPAEPPAAAPSHG
jgi:hypothetical protein